MEDVMARKCITCGKVYEYCGACPTDSKKPSWSSTYCSETCMKVGQTLISHSLNNIDDAEAVKRFEEIGLNNIHLAGGKAKEMFEKIMATKKVVKKIVKPVVVAEVKPEVEAEAPVIEEPIETEVTLKKNVTRKKRNK